MISLWFGGLKIPSTKRALKSTLPYLFLWDSKRLYQNASSRSKLSVTFASGLFLLRFLLTFCWGISHAHHTGQYSVGRHVCLRNAKLRVCVGHDCFLGWYVWSGSSFPRPLLFRFLVWKVHLYYCKNVKLAGFFSVLVSLGTFVFYAYNKFKYNLFFTWYVYSCLASMFLCLLHFICALQLPKKVSMLFSLFFMIRDFDPVSECHRVVRTEFINVNEEGVPLLDQKPPTYTAPVAESCLAKFNKLS